jgi:DNA-binding transcriptional regulator YiaG
MSDSKAERVFRAQLDEIEAAAKVEGLSKRDLAKAAGVSPATLPRWRRQSPATVRAMGKMQKAAGIKTGA